ncbi:uncharacterized protein LOC134718004 [Mytilus trossulus]|uniref:uncharacterized protein LOC134718004 n=1 Tax=Mytilus trossulus TaxID=6551 RepID=UPI00300729AF
MTTRIARHVNVYQERNMFTPCRYGFKFNNKNGQTCKCLQACPKAICHRPCEYGFIYDSTGCQTCDCRKRSCPQRLCPWGCPKEYKLGKDSCQTCDCRRGIPCPQEPICPLPNSPHPSCPGPCIYQNRILDGITCRVNCFRGLPPLPGRPGDPCPPTGCPGKPTGAAVQHDFPLNPPGTPPGNCPVGLPLPGFNCGLIPNPDKCPAGSFCNVDPMDRFGVCCLDRRCPVDQGSYFHCYGHYHRYCKDDSSCPKGKKCCKQGCSYKCVDAV